MNYQENIRSKAIALQILNDRAGIRHVQLQTLEKQIKHNSKGENFRRLANIRVPSAIKAIKNLSYLANANSYSYSSIEAKFILSTIKGLINELKRKFQY